MHKKIHTTNYRMYGNFEIIKKESRKKTKCEQNAEKKTKVLLKNQPHRARVRGAC